VPSEFWCLAIERQRQARASQAAAEKATRRETKKAKPPAAEKAPRQRAPSAPPQRSLSAWEQEKLEQQAQNHQADEFAHLNPGYRGRIAIKFDHLSPNRHR
jgi:hypothetical protein